MSIPQAYLNGRLLPATELSVSVADAGFVLGATVTEQLRTFGGRCFRLEQHLGRLARSLEIVGVDPGVSWSELTRSAQELATQNHALLEPGDDLGLAIFVTPGAYAPLAGRGAPAARPLVAMHTWPLAFALWADAYEQGQTLVTTPIPQTPAACWPPELKCRSRMHYYLADRAAAAREPGARALLLDERGRVCETAVANVVVHYAERGLATPPAERVLRGVSLAMLRELAAEAGLPWEERDLTVDEVSNADEVLLTSTASCVLPATRFNGRLVGLGQPGPVCGELLSRWSDRVQMDIAAQARRFAR